MSVSARLLRSAAREAADESDDDRIYGPPPERADRILYVHPDGHWFRLETEEPIDLMNRAPLRRILGAIVQRTVSTDAEGADVDELIEEGWPEQRPTRESGANRVYNCIRRLRDQGLEGVIVTGEAGYRIDPSISVVLRDEPSNQ